MLGAIIGDIVGSRFERNPIKNKRFKLFTKESNFTDDSVMTIASADAIINRIPYDISYKKWGNKFTKRGYGNAFYLWLSQTESIPYNSYGNGSAMRVSPIGLLYNNIEDVLSEAKKSAEVTHNHPEGIKAAQAVAVAIFLAKNGKTKDEIKNEIISRFNYDLNRNTINFKRSYKFDVTCQGSVPEAIICFLESTSFEDAIRRAVALGGDSDTQAAIAGSIAEAYYQVIPRYMIESVHKILPDSIWLRVIDAGIKFNIKSVINYKSGK